ncbi:MAG: hypothetical protein IPG07_08330 [Crocinitomicaceae bacterium]|nr:hypothetical protein [Crocinitomicaceae bacterium]
MLKISNSYKNFEVFYGDTEIAYETFTRIAHSKPLDKFWQALPFVHQSVLVKREILINNLFNLSYTYCADYDQLSKLYKSNVGFQKSDQIISRITAGGASDINAAAATREVFKISKKRFSLTLMQRVYFRTKMVKSRLASIGKRNLPKGAINKMTKRKYS